MSLQEDIPQSQNHTNQQSQKLYRKPKSISSFVAGYKSSVTSKINDLIIEKNDKGTPEIYTRKNRLWQVNYNDRIIRNEKEYYSIKNYIINNPAN